MLEVDKRVLLFGASGFVGPYLAREFHSHGYRVYGSDLRASVFSEYDDFTQCDLLDPQAVSQALESVRPTHIVNLAAISSVELSWKMPQRTMAVNVEGALNILEAARQANPQPRVLLIGSSEEYSVSESAISEEVPLNANNPYGISKITQECFAELYRERFGLKVFLVRAFNHTGVGQSEAFVLPNFCQQVAQIVKSGKPGVISVGNLAVRRAFCDVRDVVRAYRMVMESDDDTQMYNIGSEEAPSLRELLDYIIGLSGQAIRVETDPVKFRAVDNPVIRCSCGKIRDKLGWEPYIPIWATVKQMFAHYLNRT